MSRYRRYRTVDGMIARVIERVASLTKENQELRKVLEEIASRKQPDCNLAVIAAIGLQRATLATEQKKTQHDSGCSYMLQIGSSGTRCDCGFWPVEQKEAQHE